MQGFFSARPSAPLPPTAQRRPHGHGVVRVRGDEDSGAGLSGEVGDPKIEIHHGGVRCHWVFGWLL